MKNWILKIQTSRFCHKCLKAARFIGLESLYCTIWFYYLRKHPTDYMLESANFYEKNKERVDKVQEYLYDQKSKDIYRKIISFRCKKDYREFPGMEKNQYFVEDIIQLTDNEVFVDGGGYTGDTAMEFISRVRNEYKRVIVFEPDVANYNTMKETLKKHKNIVSYNKGLYNETTCLSFNSNKGSASRINETGDIVVPVVAIDDIEECKDATFIKMDIEGAELKALIGAKNTIVSNKPKLAICLYHLDADILDIIEYIHELVPSYKLYVRHHSRGQTETVLYAV